MAVCDGTGIFAEGYVEMPVAVVLDAPVGAQGIPVHLGASTATANEPAQFLRRPAPHRPLSITHPEHRQLLPLLGVVNPGHVVEHCVRAFLHPAVPALEGLIAV